MSDLLSDRYLSCSEGLTVRQIKQHIASWPDETPEGVPTRALMIVMSDAADGTYMYVPIGEVTEVTMNGSHHHLMVLPQNSVGKLIYGVQDND